MRHFLTSLLLCLPLVAAAGDAVKVDTTIVCYPIDVLLKTLKKVGEEPMVMGVNGVAPKVATVVYVNRETGSYTIVEMDNEAGCIISLGNNVRYRFPQLKSVM